MSACVEFQGVTKRFGDGRGNNWWLQTIQLFLEKRKVPTTEMTRDYTTRDSISNGFHTLFTS